MMEPLCEKKKQLLAVNYFQIQNLSYIFNSVLNGPLSPSNTQYLFRALKNKKNFFIKSVSSTNTYSKYLISSNKRLTSNERRLLISTSLLGIHIEIKASLNNGTSMQTIKQ